MEITLQPIPVENYAVEREQLIELVRAIWTTSESADNAIHSIERWGSNRNESGGYFYVLADGEIIGLTGFFKVPGEGNYGLRHHGVIKLGTGKAALDALVDYLQMNFPDFRQLVELMPEGKPELVAKFSEWGFRQVENPDLSWEPKSDYYKIMMVREIEG